MEDPEPIIKTDDEGSGWESEESQEEAKEQGANINVNNLLGSGNLGNLLNSNV